MKRWLLLFLTLGLSACAAPGALTRLPANRTYPDLGSTQKHLQSTQNPPGLSHSNKEHK